MSRSNESIVGDLINFRGLVYAPLNENDVVFLFGKVAEDLNMYIEEIKPGFPHLSGVRSCLVFSVPRRTSPSVAEPPFPFVGAQGSIFPRPRVTVSIAEPATAGTRARPWTDRAGCSCPGPCGSAR